MRSEPDNGIVHSMWDTNQAAAYLGVSPWLIRQYDKRGVLKPAVKIGRNRKYKKEDLDSWLKKQHGDTKTS